MRLIDADKFKQQVTAQAFTGNIPVEKANMLCNLIDMQPTENTGHDSENTNEKIIVAESSTGRVERFLCPVCSGEVGVNDTECSDCHSQLN